jgi:hypothetical protein
MTFSRSVAAAVLLVGLAFLATTPACVESHFPAIAAQTAAADELPCESSKAVEVEQLSSSGFRVQTCAGPRYYRCWNKRKTTSQCCQRVATESEATDFLWAPSAVTASSQPPIVCRDF